MKLPKKKVKQIIDLMNEMSEASLLPLSQVYELIDIAMNEKMLDYLIAIGTNYHTKDELKEIYEATFGNEDNEFESYFEEMKLMSFIHAKNHEERHLYGLTPIFPGWVEFYTGGETNPKREALLRKFMEFYERADGFNVGPMRYILNQHNLKKVKDGKNPRFSTLCSHPKEVTLNQPLQSEPTVILTGDVYEFLKQHQNEIAVMRCFCRNYKQLIGGGDCDYGVPLEGCFILGALATQLIENGVAKKVSFEEATQLLDTFQKNGCVHSTYHFNNNANQEVLAICNCCKDCCLVYKNYRQGGLSHIFTKSFYSPKMIDETKCVGCDLCGKYCPTEATYYDKQAKKLIFDYAKCVGCGQCVNQCHFNVREMVPDQRSVYVPSKKKQKK